MVGTEHSRADQFHDGRQNAINTLADVDPEQLAIAFVMWGLYSRAPEPPMLRPKCKLRYGRSPIEMALCNGDTWLDMTTGKSYIYVNGSWKRAVQTFTLENV